MKHERKHDESLNISTIGIREWRNQEGDYNRYEATPYKALDKFFKVYHLKEGDEVIDFGCGRGRVSFYIHDRFEVPVTGIEANDQTFEESLDNQTSYLRRNKPIDAPIHFDYGLAEDYEISATANRFYFFNPFSIHIFKKVVQNILDSVKKTPRSVDIILYYPLPEFKRYLKRETPFELMNKTKIPGIHGKYGKFVVFRLV